MVRESLTFFGAITPNVPARLVRTDPPGNNARMSPRSSAGLALALVAVASSTASADRLLLVPDTLADKVWAFSAVDGSLVSDNYIPNDGIMRQVRSIAQLPNGNLIMAEPGTSLGCSTIDGVLEYSRCGTFLRRIAGQDDGICDAQQVWVLGDSVWFTRSDDVQNSDGGANAIWRMALDGSGLTEVARPASFRRIWGFAPVAGGFIVANGASSITTTLDFVSTDGQATSVWHDPAATISGVLFAQQVSPMPGGGVVVATFSGDYGLYFFDANGNPAPGVPFYYKPLGPTLTGISPRGVYPLENGNVLYAGGTVVGVVNLAMQEEVVIVNSVSATGAARGSFHWITPIDTDLGCAADLDCSGTVDGADLGLLLGGWGAPGPADLNADGVVDGTDLGVLLGAWANCGA
ncbi:MAG: hypothetical protein RI990_2069 [Planctomycetota bacterium]